MKPQTLILSVALQLYFIVTIIPTLQYYHDYPILTQHPGDNLTYASGHQTGNVRQTISFGFLSAIALKSGNSRKARTTLSLRRQDKAGRPVHTKLRNSMRIVPLREILVWQIGFLRRISSIVYEFSADPQLLARKIAEQVKITSSGVSEFVSAVDILYGRAIKKISAAHPRLTEEDLLMCALLLAGFTASEASAMYNITSIESLYNKKYRLKAKMGLDKTQSLEDYLAGFVKTGKTRTIKHNNLFVKMLRK